MMVDKDVTSFFDEAKAWYEVGAMDRALAIYDELLKTSPEHARVWHLSGVVYFQMSRKQIDMCHENKFSDPSDDCCSEKSTWMARQKKLQDERNGWLKEGIRRLDQAVQLRPTNALFQYSLGVALGATPEALMHVQKAYTAKPGNVHFGARLAWIYKQMKKVEEAQTIYKEMISNGLANTDILYMLGKIYKNLGDVSNAKLYLKKALALDPTNQKALFWLSAVSGIHDETFSSTGSISMAPPEYVAALFDGYAATFDAHLVKQLSYQTPQILKKIVMRLCETLNIPKQWRNAVDLGCGTGLAGIEFRPWVAHLAGVDLSREMVNKARERPGVYDSLYVNDIVSFFVNVDAKIVRTNEQPEEEEKEEEEEEARVEEKLQSGEHRRLFDLVLACDVFVYLGDLHPILKIVSQHCNVGALVAFSTEVWQPPNKIFITKVKEVEEEEEEEERGYFLSSTGRFLHAPSYLERISKLYDFEVLTNEVSALRRQQNEPVMGQVTVLRRLLSPSSTYVSTIA